MTAGRHHYQPTDDDRKRVRRLAALKLPYHEIAQLITNRQTGLPIAVPTLKEYFPEELARGHLEFYAGVADRYALRLTGAKAEVDERTGVVLRAEILPSERAQERFLDTFGPEHGWGDRNGPLGNLDLTKLDDADLATLKNIFRKAASAEPSGD